MTDTLSHLDISTEARERAAERDEALEEDVQHNDESTGKELTMTQEEIVTLGADTIDDFLAQKSDELAHYGVLGMKWGVYKDGGRFNDQERVIGRNEEKALLRKTLVKGEKPGFMGGKSAAVSSLVAAFNNETRVPDSAYIPSSKPRYTRKDLDDSLEKLSKKHYDEFTQDELAQEVFKVGQFKDLKLVEHTQALGAEALKHMFESGDEEALESLEGVLAHYGVLGMKWGVRKDDRGSGRPQGGASRKKAPLSSVKKMVSSKKTKTGTSKTETQETNKSSNARVSEAKVETQQESAQKSGRSMSDQELRDAINRMQMEKTYAQLLAERNPGPAKKADSAIKTILRDSTKQAAGQLLTNTFKVIGTYAVAAAISKQNPALANALMKGVGDNAKKATETKTDSPDAPDATVSTPKTPSQNKSNTPKSNLGIPEADAWVDKTATKITNDFMATMPKAKNSSSLLDLGPTPQVDVPEWSVRRAYQNASENYTPESILDELSAYRKR